MELLFAAQQCGSPLPQNFVSKMAYAIQLAEAEGQRGKTEMKMKMAPTLGDEVVSEVFKAVGGSAASKFATADAKAKSTAQPSQKPEGTGSASSSSASAPKAKAMPRSYEPSKAHLRSLHRRKLLRNVRQDGRNPQQHLNGRKSAVSSKPTTSVHPNDHWTIRCVSSL